MSTAYPSDGSASYSLATGSLAEQRLNIQDNLLRESSYNHLKQAGLTKGMVVWDIGCGNGNMTAYIANAVGPHGHVYAMDTSQAQLNLTKQKIDALGLQNVTFILGDIQSTDNLIKESADIVYGRFVLMHLPNPDIAIANMKLLLKDKGVVVSQESIMSTAYCSYQPNVFKAHLSAKIALGKHLGVDFDIGNKLIVLYEHNDFTKIKEHYEQLEVPSQEGKMLFYLGLKEWKDKAITAKVATEEEVLEWERAFRSIPANDSSISIKMAKQAYILAWK
jgi:SAM-dependent methyltransferase